MWFLRFFEAPIVRQGWQSHYRASLQLLECSVISSCQRLSHKGHVPKSSSYSIFDRKRSMARQSVWAPKVLALIKGGNPAAAIAQIKVAPSVKDLQALRLLLSAVVCCQFTQIQPV
jgi:hypothetical protein